MQSNNNAESTKLQTSAQSTFPEVCVSCGSVATRTINLRCFNTKKQKSGLILNFLSQLLGNLGLGLLVNEVADHRPVDLRLPICGGPSCKNGRGVAGEVLHGGQVALSGLNPDFVEAVQEQLQTQWASLSGSQRDPENKWDALANQVDEAEKRRSGR